MSDNLSPPVFEVWPADTVIFYDDRFPPDPGSGIDERTAVNRVAIVVDEQGALFLDKGALGRQIVKRLPLDVLPKLRNVSFRRSVHVEHRDRIAKYFLTYVDKPAHFQAGMEALRSGNLQPLLDGKIFPERPSYGSDEGYEAAWRNLKRCLQPMDCICTVDLSSRLSRFIAWATHGPWSHIAVHVANGEIHESVTSGIRNAPIEMYKGRNHWVAAYRNIQASNRPLTGAQVEAIVSSTAFKRDAYNYRGAIKYGFKSFCGDHSHALVPNSIIYRGDFALIAHA
jgi:hypothetical protein